MPIDGISDDPEKMTEFELRGQSIDADAALSRTPKTALTLAGDSTSADFVADKLK